MTDPQADNRALLLQAALDGELDAAGMIELEARLAADPALAAEYARLVALGQAIRARAPRPKAPDALRARVIAMAETARPKPPASRARRPAPRLADYGRLAASLVLGIVVGAGVYGAILPPRGDDGVDRALVAGYIRGRLAAQSVDIATSDRHTVKPWLAGKVAGATTVVDLKGDGFPLVGGRVDVVGSTPIPTLIYQRREHQIALSEIPAPRGSVASEPRRSTRDGYALLEWTEAGRLFAAVSDLPASVHSSNA